MTLDENWFSEICSERGSAFSLKITEKLHTEQSEFQYIEIFQTETFGKLMVIDGFTMLSSFDNFLYHEMLAHPALFIHDAPQKVLIIGGGDCGTLREVLKHGSVKEAHQVDIDECVTRISEKFFPELCTSNNDARASLHFDDGIKWVKNAKAGEYDLIIIDSTDPVGPAEGLFTEKFYRDCHHALGDNGILVQQSESPLFHMGIIKPIRDAMYSAGFPSQLTINFPQCIYPSGWWSATLSGKNKVALEKFREQDVDQRSFETRYYNSAIHRAAMAQPEFMLRELEMRDEK